MCCCLSYKDTILKANHSWFCSYFLLVSAVAYPTKILFWKRITAPLCKVYRIKRCCLSYKDTILKANHSCCGQVCDRLPAVAYPTKILFWKRITAHFLSYLPFGKLLLILQRYYFESESQRDERRGRNGAGCCLSYKDTILKANHSSSLRFASSIALLLILQRYYFESESQRIAAVLGSASCCCLSYKDTILKANHS